MHIISVVPNDNNRYKDRALVSSVISEMIERSQKDGCWIVGRKISVPNLPIDIGSDGNAFFRQLDTFQHRYNDREYLSPEEVYLQIQLARTKLYVGLVSGSFPCRAVMVEDSYEQMDGEWRGCNNLIPSTDKQRKAAFVKLRPHVCNGLTKVALAGRYFCLTVVCGKNIDLTARGHGMGLRPEDFFLFRTDKSLRTQADRLYHLIRELASSPA